MASRKAAQTASQSLEDLVGDGSVKEGTEEVHQRKVDLDLNEQQPPQGAGKRVKVYNKYKAGIWMSDGNELPALSEGYILEKDANNPHIAKHILKLAE